MALDLISKCHVYLRCSCALGDVGVDRALEIRRWGRLQADDGVDVVIADASAVISFSNPPRGGAVVDFDDRAIADPVREPGPGLGKADLLSPRHARSATPAWAGCRNASSSFAATDSVRGLSPDSSRER
jgi:hypothetical protein